MSMMYRSVVMLNAINTLRILHGSLKQTYGLREDDFARIHYACGGLEEVLLTLEHHRAILTAPYMVQPTVDKALDVGAVLAGIRSVQMRCDPLTTVYADLDSLAALLKPYAPKATTWMDGFRQRLSEYGDAVAKYHQGRRYDTPPPEPSDLMEYVHERDAKVGSR